MSRDELSLTLLEENLDHLTHGTTGLITWQVPGKKAGHCLE